MDCLQKWGSIGIRIFRSLQSGGSIGIKGARKPCKFHAFLMISVPALFSVSFCFPLHTLRLLANRRFTRMSAHILPLVSSASFAQAWAWLKKRLQVARNLLFARVPFRGLFVPFSFSLFPPPSYRNLLLRTSEDNDITSNSQRVSNKEKYELFMIRPSIFC